MKENKRNLSILKTNKNVLEEKFPHQFLPNITLENAKKNKTFKEKQQFSMFNISTKGFRIFINIQIFK